MSRGSSGLHRALRIILDVANSLRMSAGAMLLRTGSQSVLVQRTESVMVLMPVVMPGVSVMRRFRAILLSVMSFLWIVA